MEKVVVNSKVYSVEKELDFNYLVMLDKNDVDVSKMAGLAGVNCFLAYISGMSEEEAANEISLHVINGGTLNDIIDSYGKALEESGFFRKLMEQAEKKQEEVEQTDEETSASKKKDKVVSE